MQQRAAPNGEYERLPCDAGPLLHKAGFDWIGEHSKLDTVVEGRTVAEPQCIEPSVPRLGATSR
jgi:hypothetical protein